MDGQRRTVRDANVPIVHELNGRFWSSEKVAEVTGHKVSTIPGLVAAGRLKPVKFGGVYAFDADLVEAYAAEKKAADYDEALKKSQRDAEKREQERKAQLADELATLFPGSNAANWKRLPITALEQQLSAARSTTH